MSTSQSDRNLLVGILALKLEFVTQDELIEAMSTWVNDKTKAIDEILFDRKFLDLRARELVLAVVDKHVSTHAGDIPQALQTAGSVDESVRSSIAELSDAELTKSLTLLGSTRSSQALQGAQADVVGRENRSVSSLSFDRDIRYQKQRVHAKGGLGQVSVALDLELSRKVALKEIQPRYADDPESQSRFTIEAEVTGNLEHPGIVPVYGLGRYSNGHPYYAMRFIEGETLKDAAAEFHQEQKSQTPRDFEGLAFRRLLRRFVDVCNAVEYAHSRGVIHRDIKPSNIMLGGFGETLLVDWGLAKANASQQEESALRPASLGTNSGNSPGTQLGRIIGTPQFMSPEQAEGKIDQLGPRSDVYSLGATLYVLLTGRPAFELDDIHELIGEVIKGEFPSPSEQIESVPRPLNAICLRAMARKAEDRFTSPKDLAEEVERWLGDEAVQSYPEPISTQVWRWIRHHKTLVSSSAITTMLTLLSSIIIIAIVAWSNKELRLANEARKFANDRLGESNELLEQANSELTERNLELQQAYQRIQVEEQKVREERDIAEALNDFVRFDLLAQASPFEEPNRNLRLRSVLDRAAVSVQGRLSDYPIVEAEIASVIGNTYSDLGEYDLAQPLLKRARDLMVEQRGDRHPRTLSSCNNLAVLLLRLGEFEAAEELLAPTYREMLQVNGAEDRDTLTAAQNLSAIYRETARFGEADALLRDAMATLSEKFGDAHPQTLSARNALAVVLKQQGRFLEAQGLSDTVFNDSAETLGAQHPTTLLYAANLATICAEQGDTVRAQEIYESVLEDMDRILGSDHQRTLASKGNLGLLYDRQGNYVDADRILTPLLPESRIALGPNHPLTIRHAINLGLLRISQRRWDDSVKLLESTLVICQSELGDSDPNTISCLYNLATALRHLGRLDEAGSRFAQLVEITREVQGDNHPDTLATRGSLAGIFVQQQRYEEAESIYRDVLAIRELWYGDEHPGTTTTKNNLGYLYLEWDKLDDAAKLFEEVYELRRKQHGEGDVDTLISANNLASVFRAQTRFEAAETLFRNAVNDAKESLGESHPERIELMRNLAAMFMQQERWEDARQIYEDAFSASTERFGKQHRITVGCEASLALAELRSGKVNSSIARFEGIYERNSQIHEPAHPNLISSAINLAMAYAAAGRHEDARPLFERALKESDSLPPSLKSQVIERLIQTYEALGEFDKANGLRQKQD